MGYETDYTPILHIFGDHDSRMMNHDQDFTLI